MENRQGGEKPRVIYNRDIPKLERVNVIMKEVCRLEERMAWQKDRAYNVTRRLTGMPTAHGGENGRRRAFCGKSFVLFRRNA